MKIEVIGLGVIGSVVFESLVKTNQFQMIGVEIDTDKLQERIEEFEDYGDMEFSNIILPADVFIICVPTPLTESKKPDLKAFWEVISDIIQVLKSGDLIIVNSTIPPDTMKEVTEILENDNFKVGEDTFLTYCPERILPGKNIMKEFRENTRIISGDRTSCEKANEVYETITVSEHFYTSFINAELIKLAENSYRDINIAFANELAKISKYYQADIKEIIQFANFHPRVNIHQPGLGVGGHCIAVDPFFLMNGGSNKVLKTAREVNSSMPSYCANRLQEELPKAKNIVVIGLSYKPNVDDKRNSPATELVKILRERGYTVRTFDPILDYEFFPDVANICKKSDCIIIGCDHTCFRLYPIELLRPIAEGMASPVMLSPFLTDYGNWKQAGFKVINIFRGVRE